MSTRLTVLSLVLFGALAPAFLHAQAPDLQASLSAPSSVLVGDIFTVTVTVINLSTTAATNVAPSTFSLQASSGSPAMHVLSGPSPANADIGSAGSQDFTYVVQADADGTGAFVGQVSSNELGSSNLAQAPDTSIVAPTDTPTQVPDTDTPTPTPSDTPPLPININVGDSPSNGDTTNSTYVYAIECQQEGSYTGDLYSFTLGSESLVHISTCDGNVEGLDTVIGLFSDAAATNEIDCDDDASKSCANPGSSVLDEDLGPGTYYVVVEGVSGAQGPLPAQRQPAGHGHADPPGRELGRGPRHARPALHQ